MKGISITPEDIITMKVFDEHENVILNDYWWYYSKEVDILADHCRVLAGWWVLGYKKEV